MATLQADLRDAVIDTAASGDTEVVAAQDGKKIVVHAYAFVCADAVSVRWKSGSTSKSGLLPCVANSGISVPGGASTRCFATAIGAALNINLSAAVAVGGHLTYSLEPR
jgi:hypothetical protein